MMARPAGFAQALNHACCRPLGLGLMTTLLRAHAQLSATRTFSKDGTTYSEEYIGMVDPWAKQFLMWSVDGTDQMLGTITPQEDAFTIRLSGLGHIWDRVCRGELCGCELNKRDVVRNRNPRNPKLAGGNAAYASLAGLQHTCRH